MSLNKFTDTNIKTWMKIGCEDITAVGDVVLKGNVIPDANTTPGYVLKNVDGKGDCAWVVENGGGGFVSFTGTPPVQIGEIPLYNSVDGEALAQSGVLLSTLTTDIANNTSAIAGKVSKSGDTMSGDLSLGNHNLNVVNTANISTLAVNNVNATNLNIALTTNANVINTATLVASGATTLRGNVIPSNITTPGYYLQNSNGSGSLSWSPISPASSTGFYSPSYAMVGGGSISSATNQALYINFGNIVKVSGSLVINTPSSGLVANLVFNTPPGTLNNNADYSCVCVGGFGVSGRPSLVNFDYTMSPSNTCSILLQRADASNFTISQQYVIWYDISFRNTA